MKHTCTDSIKFKRLHRRLGFRARRETIGLLEALWHLTIKVAPRGNIGCLDNIDIAIELEWEGDPDFLVNALVSEKWIDEHPAHRLVVHDWADHCPNFVKGNAIRMGGFCVDPENENYHSGVSSKEPPKRPSSKEPPLTTVVPNQINQTKHNHSDTASAEASPSTAKEFSEEFQTRWRERWESYRSSMPAGDGDTQIVVVLAWLVESQHLEHAVVIEAIDETRRKKPTKPGAYLRKVLVSKLTRQTLDYLLALAPKPKQEKQHAT